MSGCCAWGWIREEVCWQACCEQEGRMGIRFKLTVPILIPGLLPENVSFSPLSWEVFPGKETSFQGDPSLISNSSKDEILNLSISIQSNSAVGAALCSSVTRCIHMIKQNSSQHQHSQLDLKWWFKRFKNSLNHPLLFGFLLWSGRREGQMDIS